MSKAIHADPTPITAAHPDELALLVKRVRLARPLSIQQFTIAAMLSDGYTKEEIAVALSISEYTVMFHVREAAERVPGDRGPVERLVYWYRGATLQVLTGRWLFNDEEVTSPPLESGSAKAG